MVETQHLEEVVEVAQLGLSLTRLATLVVLILISFSALAHDHAQFLLSSKSRLSYVETGKLLATSQMVFIANQTGTGRLRQLFTFTSCLKPVNQPALVIMNVFE